MAKTMLEELVAEESNPIAVDCNPVALHKLPIAREKDASVVQRSPKLTELNAPLYSDPITTLPGPPDIFGPINATGLFMLSQRLPSPIH